MGFDTRLDESFDPDMTEKDIEAAFLKSLEKLVDMKGFCTKKSKYKIESVNDFITKLQDKMAVYCQQFLG